MITLPVVPVDSVSKAFMFPFQIEPIQVRVMASTIPPGSFESCCTIISPGIIVFVHSTKLGSFLWKTFSPLTVHTGVNYPEFVKFCTNYEVIDQYLSFIVLPVLHFYQKLLRTAKSNIVPICQSDPMLLFWISKAVSVIIPLFQKKVFWTSKISSSL